MAHEDEGWFSRERALTLVLVAITALAVFVCYLLAAPFLPALAWATALAILTHPLHVRLERKLKRPSLAAAISVAGVVVALLVPATFVVSQIVRQLMASAEQVQTRLIEFAGRYQELQPVAEFFQSQQLPQQAQEALRSVASTVPAYVGGSLWALAQLLFTVFILFYFFRDWRAVLKQLKSLLPLTADETNRTLQRIQDTIFATLYGSVTVALIQGTLGGLMFWFVGLPAPLVWGAVMALLAVIPTLGTFLIWLPAAVYLAVNGDYAKAVILVAWGGIAIGLIDNLLYPILVGRRLRLHPLLVFIAIVGGVIKFGMAGIVLGPVALSVTEALIDVWRRRTAGGNTADAPRPSLTGGLRSQSQPSDVLILPPGT